MTLDGISTVSLRERFRAWAAGDVAQQGLGKHDPTTLPWFSSFIMIGGEVKQKWVDVLLRSRIGRRSTL